MFNLAASPIRRSFPSNDTTDGVVNAPASFGIISTFPFLYTATHEYVVPKSIPIALLILFYIL